MRAHATRSDLARMWGRLRVTEGTETEPLVIERRSMGNLQVWKFVHPSKQGPVFELVRGGGE